MDSAEIWYTISMHTLILLRHGESEWNRENLFTGWSDVDLDEVGIGQAKMAGKLLQKANINIDVAYTSYLKRAIRTLWILLDTVDHMWVPVNKSWRLNERHYGALQGLNKSETAAEYGEEQVKTWRRSYTTRPPRLRLEDQRHPFHDRIYQGFDPVVLPNGESHRDAFERVFPYWVDEIAPQLKSGKTVLVTAHGNSLRSLVKHIDSIEDDAFMELNIPIGEPLVYELDENLRPIRHYYLNSEEEIQRGLERQIEMGKAFLSEVG